VPAVYKLQKILKTNTTYEMEKDRYYVIKRIGTDAAAKVTAKVDGIPVLDIFSTIAPIAKTSSNVLVLWTSASTSLLSLRSASYCSSLQLLLTCI
jgi:hypothetical protein